MHVYFMKIIAETGTIPRVMPHLAAVVDSDGEIRAYLPYQYTQLYHLLGGAVYKVFGQSGCLLLGPVFAAILAVLVFRLTAVTVPALFAALGFLLALLSRTSVGIFTWVFMEPMVLTLFVAGLLAYRRVWQTPNLKDAVVAGVFFGLAIGARQSALMYLAAVVGHASLSLTWNVIRANRPTLMAAGRYYICMISVSAAVAAPFLGYLYWSTGNIGYGAIAFPWSRPTLSVDPAANAYIRSITTPEATVLEWAPRFHRTLVPMSDSVPLLVEVQPYVLFLLGTLHLLRQAGKVHAFIATYAPVHILTEFVVFLTIHGNARYVVGSRFLFYPIVAAGAYVIFAWLRSGSRLGGPLLSGSVAAVALLAFGPAFASLSFLADLWSYDEAAAARGRAYAAAGAWVRRNVPEGSLLLSARTYDSAFHFERDVAWVTEFGNYWAVEAAQEKRADRARDLLRWHGVDYVVMQNPPGSYVDRMPRDGLRHIVLVDTEHFKRVYINDGVRIYRFLPDGRRVKSRLEAHSQNAR